MNGTFCLTFLVAGGSSAFAISFEAVSVGPGSHDVRQCKSVDMMSSFTSLYSKLEIPRASKGPDMPVPNCFKEQTRNQISTTILYKAEGYIFISPPTFIYIILSANFVSAHI